ncbi:MAG: adenylate/guanylate cyclase domain-containing protein, partial [Actinomycetota bacterium]
MIPETRYAKTTDGFHIAYQTLGDGPTDVVSVATYFSNLEHDWANPTVAGVQRSLAELGRLIRFDARGTGLSDGVSGDRLPSLEERIDDLRAVLDAVDSERAVLVAFADGGPLCCLFAATYPGRTKAMILNNTGPRTAWAPDYPWGMTPEEFDAELASTETRWGTREYAADTVRMTTPQRANDDALIDWWAASMRQSASPSAAVALLRMYHDMDVREVLPAIHVPTLVLASDPAAEESEAMARQIPGALFMRIHSPAPVVMANPELFFAEIRRFVSRVGEEEADLDRVLETVLFTDIVGSTELAADRGDRAWQELVERHHAFVRGVLARWRGREMDTAGDGFFAAFDGPARAIRCAQAIVDGVRSMGIEVRAGLHTGECDITDGKVAGITVVIGSRIASLAAPSEVLVSRTVRDLVAGSGLSFEDRGEH